MSATFKPQVSFWQIWNMCFGFLGLQFAFQLQNSNVSRIFQTLGASIDDLPILWVAAPLTGLLVQPIVGYYSDRTWNWLGRRRPYFLAGALLASFALIAMPRSPVLWIAASLLWILDASINIAMEPFRAFVGDQLPERQRPAGYAMQSFFIGVGAVIAGVLPWIFAHAGVSNVGTGAGAASIPDTLRYSFDIGAVVLAAAMLWTIFTTREYPPGELHGFADATPLSEGVTPGSAAHAKRRGALWFGVGIAGALLVWHFQRRAELYILCGLFGAWGVALLSNAASTGEGMFATLMRDIDGMPMRMRQLIPVQFFSWLALFAMWLYTNPAVTQVHFHATDTIGVAYNEGANWVGVLFSAYSGFAALAAIVIPIMVRKLGLPVSHFINLLLGGVGLASFLVIRDPDWLLASMVGVGFAWASIVSLPYALLAGSVPSRKMGVYMGVFNFFIVIPQLVAASVLSDVLKPLLGGQPIYVLVVGGVSFVLAGILALRVK
ncbi:MAG TPA: MFS transporter [Steroidobacteraceae bacterium]|jgi:maltose/moltooligosaccharide transporter|nr:MFS transporter [Steroidobacteraceae bacterium]